MKMGSRSEGLLPCLRWLGVVVTLCWVLQSTPASAAPNKWTIFIYMLADNDLEQFGLMDLEEVMSGMAAEPVGCATTACGGSCPSGTVFTYSTPCSAGQGSASRCCPAGTYPDVLLLVDRGTGQPTTYLQNNSPHADYTLLNNEWTTAKELIAMPGGQWNQLKDWGEIDMSKPETVSRFLAEGLVRYPPSADRKYMLVFWDHGSGWSGYGVDHTCTSTATYSQNWGCDILSIQKITQGLQAGLKDSTGAPVRLDIIGFDACLMAMYEVGALLSPYSHYLLASELLEPGHGWDYSAPIKGLIQQRNAAGQSLTSFEAKDIGDLVIKGYMDQAAYYETSGLTLGLLDLDIVSSTLKTAVNSMTKYMSTQLQNSPAYSMGVLRKRALLASISGADDNVDMGAMLTGFRAMAGTSLLPLVNASAGAYKDVVRGYQRDGELSDGTGMAVYFPSSSLSLDARYITLVASDSTSLNDWLAFLQGLYTATNLYTSTGSLGPFKFVETNAVNYLARSTNTWITHGTLTNYLGLTASLMYGFRTPSGTEFLTAGSTEANIVEKSAVGTWSGYLFGLVQDLVDNDDAVDGLALAYADESRLVDSSGAVKQLILQVKVYYSSSCYASRADMKNGIIKYVYDTTTTSTTMQLFVSSSGGSWGEVPPAQGGVVIPYLGSYNLSKDASADSKVGVTFKYSDCLKWGKSDHIQLAAFKARQAADVLGFDIARDMETQLLVNSMDGATVSISGFFKPAQKTLAGCQCSQLWPYTGTDGTTVYLNGTCINPTNDPKGAWCMYEPDSCINSSAVANATETWDYCAPTITLSGCKCHPHWTLNNKHYYGSSVDDGDARGPWCVVDMSTCPGTYRAHQFGGSNTINATIDGQSGTLTGLDFDHTKQVTVNGCRCRNPWKYDGMSYNGTCRQGLPDNKVLPGFSADTTWCYIDEGCKGAGDFNGHSIDICTPEGGRVTTDGSPCKLPTAYDAVPMYDCLPYKHNTGVTTTPWCFTADGTQKECAAYSCSGPVKVDCPATDPSQTGADLSGWAVASCLEALCGTRQALVNVSQCTTDSPADRDMLQQRFQFLNSSSAFGQLLAAGGGPGSLASYCDVKYGQLCVDLVVDPVCPALFRENNKWWINRDKSQVCNMDCLTTLCKLQEHSKTRVQGVSSWQSTVAQARGYSLAASTCADASLENLVRWTLMESMDNLCMWPGPVNLACNRLLSPPQLCAAKTTLTDLSGNITDGVVGNAYYSPSSSCSWTINTPDRPYITVNFSRFATEQLYDILTVEDFDGVIGMFSGSDIPDTVSTDTGLINLQFTSDGTVQGHGFAASYVASATPQVKLPTCDSRSKLMQVVLRSRQYGSELSWLVSKRSASASNDAPSTSNVVMAGGLLPVNIKSKVPQAVAAAADPEYKDYRSYYSYACLPLGDYNLNLYDSYGDGWSSGRITLTQMVNTTVGCQLLSESLNDSSSETVPFSITADADISIEACSNLVTRDSAPFYAEVGMVFVGEEPSSFSLAKQRKVKEALAVLLNSDVNDITILEISSAKQDALDKVQWSSIEGTGSGSKSLRGGNVSGGSDIQQVIRRNLLSDIQQDEAPVAGHGSIQHMLDQQAVGHLHGGSTASISRRKALSSLAIPVGDLVSAGVFDGHRELLADEMYRIHTAAVGDAASAGATTAANACVGSTAKCDAAAATPGAAGAAADFSEPGAATRSLQQMLMIGEAGQWQTGVLQNPGTAAAADTSSTDDQPSGTNSAASAASDQTASTLSESTDAGSKPSETVDKPSATADSEEPAFTISEGPGDVPAEPAAVDSNQPSSTSASSTATSSDSADLSAVLAAQPVLKPDLASGHLETHVLNTNLERLLHPLSPVIGPKMESRSTSRPKTVQLTVSFKDAFTAASPVVVASYSNQHDGDAVFLTNGASWGGDVSDRLIHDGPAQTKRSGSHTTQPADLESSHSLVQHIHDAVRPTRSLKEVNYDDSSSKESTGSSSGSHHSKHHKKRHHKHQEASSAAAQSATVRPEAAAEFVREGRIRHGTPRPRPKPVVQERVLLQQQSAPAGAAAASGNQEKVHVQNLESAGSTTPRAIAQQQKQEQQGQTFRLMGPKKPLKRKPPQPVLDPVSIHRVPESIPLAGSTSSADGSEDTSGHRRALLATASSGVLVVARVSGFKSQKAASAAANDLEALIVNGTLVDTLASQGWRGVTVGVAFTRTGVRLGRLGGVNTRLIAAVAAVGGIALLALLIGLYIMRKRRRGAALPPEGQFISESSALMGQQQRPAQAGGGIVTGVPVAGYPTSAPLQQVSAAAAGYNSARSHSASPLPRVADMSTTPTAGSPRSQAVVGSDSESYMQQALIRSNSPAPRGPGSPAMLQ